jgi:N-glycosylase/DNA lyase
MTKYRSLGVAHLETLVLDACDVIGIGKPRRDPTVDLPPTLLSCVLGSRVRHEVAVGSTTAVWAAVSVGWRYMPKEELEASAYHALRDPDSSGLRYPFPNRGACLVKQALEWLRDGGQRTIRERLPDLGPREARRALMDCPGLGPKQASLFMRCLRPTARIAVLDSRVMEYLRQRLPLLVACRLPRHIAEYERIEAHYLEYATWLDRDPAVLDLAIWYVSRALSEVCA